MLLIMSVYPGFGGQKYIPASTEKIRKARKLIDESGYGILLEADGGITPDNAAEVIRAGTDVIVAGSAVFGAADMKAAVSALKVAGQA